MLDGKKSSIAVPTELLEADTTNTVFWHCLRFALIGTEKKCMNEDFSKQTLLAFFFSFLCFLVKNWQRLLRLYSQGGDTQSGTNESQVGRRPSQ